MKAPVGLILGFQELRKRKRTNEHVLSNPKVRNVLSYVLSSVTFAFSRSPTGDPAWPQHEGGGALSSHNCRDTHGDSSISPFPGV